MKKLLLLLTLTALTLLSCGSKITTVNINKMHEETPVYKTEVKINGVVTVPMIIDTGASDVSLPPYVVKTLLLTGTLTMQDTLPSMRYRYANGEISVNRRFMIKTMSVGDIVVTNVEASLGNDDNTPLLLGGSFFQRLKKVEIDYQEDKMRLTK